MTNSLPKAIPDGRKTDQDRLRQLAKIESTIRLSRQLASHPIKLGPAGYTALFAAVLYAVLVNALEASLDHTRWHVSGDVGILISGAAAILAGVVAYRRSPYKTYTGRVYGLLAEYEPVDAEGFRLIQGQAESGSLNSDDILQWVGWERQEIRRRSGQTETLSQDTAARLEFIRKRL
ncbi:hypothetical protein KDX16_15960 [Burkholderia vietnamiensis]|jgi:hypothetical protein|uniref:Uncharacterized protein n=1 Tax=Burkholderia aenigmatica TaxID=2015348 RepID=A0A6P2LLB7_9BURK|nr:MULTISPECIES: hypothetical protein [Burkholderia]HDR9761884.1 hypothetical protein [Burkholderia cepacia ATCC 25416]MBR7917319.1 hypothetical protein [Burkholderia vietnamiensis]MBR8055224.1 hypothetical protein [Burkholderia vietnamiensis]VWB72482.1 hypothetical protein BLA13014_03295 [Burkholderia aenigmatica]HDR9791992.1 hypothetical protein [Burkholderia cepacia ATCC 25416]